MIYETFILPTFHIDGWELKKAIRGCIEYIKIGDKIRTNGYLFNNNNNEVLATDIIGTVNDIFYSIEDNYPGAETNIIKYISVILDENIKENLRKLTNKNKSKI